MNAHTPGRWNVQPGEINIGPHNKGLMVGPLQYAKVHVIGPFEGALDEETRANARLIAAAPELLEAAQFTREEASPMDASDDFSAVIIPREAYMALRAAIIKATGDA